MEGTTHQEIAQACSFMHVYLQGHCTAFQRVFDALPEERRQKIEAHSRALWEEIAAAKREALSEAAQQDGVFQQFKDGLLVKPKRARRSQKTVA